MPERNLKANWFWFKLVSRNESKKRSFVRRKSLLLCPTIEGIASEELRSEGSAQTQKEEKHNMLLDWIKKDVNLKNKRLGGTEPK